MRKITLIILLVCVAFPKSSTGTLAYFQNGERLRLYHMRKMMKDNLIAYKEVKNAELNSEIHTVLAFAGTFMLGWALGTVIAGKDTDVKLLAAGVGLVALSIPFALSRDRYARKAVKKYNYDMLP